jgi:hypothetical protein
MKPNEDRDQRKAGSKEPVAHVRVHLVNVIPVVGLDLTFLWKQMRWNNPRSLVTRYTSAIAAASNGLVQYHIVSDRNVMKPFPLVDGYQYTGDELREVIERKKNAHTPSFADYKFMLDGEILDSIRQNQVDEVWIMAHPFAGLWEAAMGGPDAFNVNGGPILETASAGRRFVVMGFNYERGLAEMLESFGHRVERTLSRAFGADQQLDWYYRRENYGVVPRPAVTQWEQYLSDHGTVHRDAGAPKLNPDGSAADYSWRSSMEDHHQNWLAGLLPDWWRRVVNVNDYF